MYIREIVFFSAVALVTIWYLQIYYRRKPSRRLSSIDAVVPAYNEALCIENTLNSLLQNRYIHRVICVNDGSTDSTSAVLEHMRTEGRWGDRLHIIHQKNTGKGGALMHGIRHVQSDVVFLTDADTLVPNDDSLGYLLAEIEAGADAAGGVCDVNLHKAGWLAHMRASVKAPVVILQRAFQQMIGGAPFIVSGGCGLFKTTMLRKYGFSDRTKVEDLDLTWTLVSHGYKVRIAPRCMVYTQECRYIKDEWRKYKRWIVGYAVCMRLHKELLLTRFGFGTILPMSGVVFFGVVAQTLALIKEFAWHTPHTGLLVIFSSTWMLVLLLVAATQAWRHRNFWLIPLSPLSIPHLLMTYVVWVLYGVRGFFTGREPERDKPTRYLQIVGKIRKRLHIQLPGILHMEVQHLTHGNGCLMLATESVTQWITALHVPDNSPASFSAFLQHMAGNCPVKIRKIINFDNSDGQAFQEHPHVQQFCKFARIECVLVQAQRANKISSLLVQALQMHPYPRINSILQKYVQLHNWRAHLVQKDCKPPMQKMRLWYARVPKIFITPPVPMQQADKQGTAVTRDLSVV